MEFKEKFIAFVDVLGFKAMVEAAENGTGRSLPEIREILSELGTEKDKQHFEKYGPTTCPHSRCLQRNLDFQLTQVSDCVVASAEVSPAGLINLVHHCWGAAITLLSKGVMVRGYITRGKIHHDGSTFMGTGYHEAFQREAGVAAFKKEADEKGTPFIEVDASVTAYAEEQGDECVRKLFDRMVKSDGQTTALFPFQRLAHSFMIGGFGRPPFDPEKEKASNDNVRKTITRLMERVTQYVDPNNARALKKAKYYLSALNEQLEVCNRTDAMIDLLGQPAGGRRYSP